MPHPIDSYFEAMEAMRSGDSQTASLKIAESLGLDAPTEAIKNGAGKFLESGTPAHEAYLDLLSFEVEKHRRKNHG